MKPSERQSRRTDFCEAETDRENWAAPPEACDEIPDPDAAVRELARVLRPGGRLVVGELLGDPHYVTLGTLRSRAEAAGLAFERRVGPKVGYFARFRA